MKRYRGILLTVLLCAVLLSGCGKKEKPAVVYSFKGGDEVLSVSNGVIVLLPEEELFFGGELTCAFEEMPQVKSYTVDFFTLADGEKHILSESSVVYEFEDEANALPQRSELPSVRGDVFSDEAEKDIEDNFYFELRYETADGEEETRTVKMELVKVMKFDNES